MIGWKGKSPPSVSERRALSCHLSGGDSVANQLAVHVRDLRMAGREVEGSPDPLAMHGSALTGQSRAIHATAIAAHQIAAARERTWERSRATGTWEWARAAGTRKRSRAARTRKR